MNSADPLGFPVRLFTRKRDQGSSHSCRSQSAQRSIAPGNGRAIDSQGSND